VSIIVQICRSLAYLHSRGVIHGDLKPANVLQTDDQVKIVDFGIALEIRTPEARARYYTPGYSAPELKEQRPIDHRADLYSLGALWYALLMGEPPLFMLGAERLIRFALREVLEEQDGANMAEVILKLLATSPDSRYSSANEVIEAINRMTGNTYVLETRETAESYALRVQFVNREVEIETLRAIWREAKDNRGQVVLINGESGVGKTRLVAELEMQAEMEGARVVWGQCVESGGEAYHPWREVLRVLVRYVETKAEATMQHVGPVLATLLPELWQRDDMASLDSPVELEPKAAQLRLNNAILRVMKATVASRPTMIVIDNAHWADEATLELLRFLTRISMPRGLLICVVYRSYEIDDEHTLASLSEGHVHRLPLQTLSPEVTADLARSMLGLKQAPALLMERMQRATGGNAFFVQELIRTLAAEGRVLRRTVAGWEVDDRALQETQLPESIQQVVRRRLIQLSEDTRQILVWAAVVGLVFWEGTVAEVGHVTRAEVRTGLRELLEQGLVVVRDETAFVGEREYLFLNPTVREVSYESIAPIEQKQYHSRVAAWLIARSDEGTGEHLGLIAEHLASAGQAEQAVAYLRRAGEQAVARFANTEAVRYFSRALDLTPTNELVRRYTLLLAREKVYHLQGACESQLQDIDALEELADVLDNHRRRAEVAIRRAIYAEATSNYPLAVTSANAAIAASRAAKDVGQEATAHNLLGTALMHQGEYTESQRYLERGLALAQESGALDVQATSLLHLGLAAYYQNDFVNAQVFGERALCLFRESGDPQSEGMTLNNLGLVFTDYGDYVSAKASYEQSLQIFRDIGDRRNEALPLGNLGWLSDKIGDYGEAEIYYKQARHIAREVGNQRIECGLLSNLGWTFHSQGDDEKALVYSQQALDQAEEIGNQRWQGYALNNVGQALVGLGRLAEAANYYQQALDLRRELGQHQLAMDSLTGLAQIALAQEDVEQAQVYVEEILPSWKERGLEGAEDPFNVYLICYRVLRANRDPRAQAILQTAYDLLQEQAIKITDAEMRRSFLENVAAHREIIQAWEQAQG